MQVHWSMWGWLFVLILSVQSVNVFHDKWQEMKKYEEYRVIVGLWHPRIVCYYSTEELWIHWSMVGFIIYFDTTCASMTVNKKNKEMDKLWTIKCYYRIVVNHNIMWSQDMRVANASKNVALILNVDTTWAFL